MANETLLRELRNLIERNHADAKEDYLDLKQQVARDVAAIGARMDQFVLREVFEAKEVAKQAQHDVLASRIADLESERKTGRAAVRAAIFAAVAAVAASVATAIIVPVLTKGG